MPEHARAQPEQDEQQEAVQAPPPARQAAPGRAPLTAARVLDLQRGAGNAAVSAMLGGRPTVARLVTATHRTHAEILALKLSEFVDHADAQADWATEPGRPSGTPAMAADDVEKLRRLLEFARRRENGRRPIVAGCGDMTVGSLLAANLDDRKRELLARYCAAVARTRVTVELEKVADVATGLQYGEALEKLEATPGPGVSHAIFDQTEGRDTFGRLLRSGFLDDFINYCTVCHPLLEAPHSEIDSYLALRREGADPVDYHSTLPRIRNYHRFERAALDALVRNFAHTRKDKPLFLILHSNFDHNGAFHRDPNLTAVIRDSRHLTLMIEGKETLAEIQGELRPLAQAYGEGDRIQQVMFAGHGNSNVIQMAGRMDTDALNRGEAADDAEINQSLTSGPGQTAETDALMRELLANMANDPNARIVLNGCLTASNSVDAPLDPDPDAAARQVSAAINAEPSLQTYLQQAAARAGSPVSVRGANASFGQVGLQDAAGNLDIVAAGGADPQLTASKLDYIRGGTEPQGALRAVLEVWAADRLATPRTTSAIDAVRTRLRTEAASPAWDPRIIRTLYEIVSASPDDAELIRRLGVCAGDLGELKFEQNCRVSKLNSVPAAQAPAIYTGLTATSFWGSRPRIPLVVLQQWMLVDDAKRADFLAKLGTDFTCNTARRYVDFGVIGAALPALLPVAHAATPSRGELKLALLGVTGDAVDATSRAFLRAVIGAASEFPAALDIDGLLGGGYQQADVEIAIGVRSADGGAPPDRGGGRAADPNNVDLNRNGVNDFRIDPMTRRGAVAATVLNVRARPGMDARIIGGLPQGSAVEVIGSSGDWYAIENRGRVAFVHKNWVTLEANL